jgi:hypothetical protein
VPETDPSPDGPSEQLENAATSLYEPSDDSAS